MGRDSKRNSSRELGLTSKAAQSAVPLKNIINPHPRFAMTDYKNLSEEVQKLLVEIRRIMDSDSSPDKDELTDVVGRYADVVRVVNDELRACDSLLRQGLRGEAIQRSERVPKLLEEIVPTIAILENEGWLDFVQLQKGQRLPPPLMVEVATDINDAYLFEASLEKLLGYHRLHALMRSPLATRIKTLRRIADRDQNNPVWTDDIRIFERVRLRDMRKDCDKAFQRKDLAAIAALEDEAQSGEWLESPSENLVKKIVQAHTRLRVGAAKKELRTLVDELTEAYSAFDVPQGRQLRSRWKALAAIAIDDDNDELVELAEPALNWLGQEDERETIEKNRGKVLANLKTLIENDAAYEPLKQAENQVLSFDEGLPDGLRRRLYDRYEDLDRKRRFRALMMSAAVFGCIVVLAVAIGFAAQQWSQRRQWGEAIASVSQYISSGNTEEARRELNNLQSQYPGIEDSPTYRKAKSSLLAKKKELASFPE